MKRFFYILFISFTVIFSFGFRGCNELFCYLSTIFSHAAWGNNRLYAIGDYQIASILNPSDCLDSIFHVSVYSLSDIKSIEPSTREGLSIFCATGDTGTVVLSSDGGNTWEDRSVPGLTKNLYSFDFLKYLSGDVQIVVCGENGTIYKSTDSGSGWDWQQFNTNTTRNLTSIVAISTDFFLAVGDSGTIIRSSDGGQTWGDKSVAQDINFNRLFNGSPVSAIGYAWAVADGGKIYATTNYGNFWFPQFSGVTDDLYDISFRNQNEGIVVGANGVVRYTTNAGMNWLADSYFNGLTDGDIIAITGVDSNTATALIRGGTDNPGGTTMMTVSSEPLDVDDEDIIPLEYSLEQNYPNPFNPSTVISYQLPVTSFVTLKVYDVLGNEITTLVNEEKLAGSYEVEFYPNRHSSFVGNLTSGIYFYKMTAGNFTETKKLVLMK